MGGTAGPAEVLEWFVQSKEAEYAKSTIYSYRSRVGHFVEFCNKEGKTLDELEPRDIDRFKSWRFNDHTPKSVKTQMDSLRIFLRWCEARGYVAKGLPAVAESPRVRGAQRDDIVRHERAQSILNYLSRYEYASYAHALLAIIWHSGVRMGAARGIDLDDVDLSDGHVELRHRPTEDTPLKNQERGERTVALGDDVCELLRDYIKVRRVESVDEFDREPLFTSKHGRRSLSGIRRTAYTWTRPCAVGNECPDDREIASCDAAGSKENSFQCPDSSAAHALRRGRITYYLSEDVPDEIVSGRCDVTPRVIDMHYDGRDELQKMEQRRQYLPD